MYITCTYCTCQKTDLKLCLEVQFWSGKGDAVRISRAKETKCQETYQSYRTLRKGNEEGRPQLFVGMCELKKGGKCKIQFEYAHHTVHNNHDTSLQGKS